MYSAAPISTNNDPYKVALKQYNDEKAAEAIAAARASAKEAKAAKVAATAAAAPSFARRAVNWLKRNVFCCCTSSA